MLGGAAVCQITQALIVSTLVLAQSATAQTFNLTEIGPTDAEHTSSVTGERVNGIYYGSRAKLV